MVSDTPLELAAIERGAGPAVTLIHGGVFHSGPAWAKTIGPLVQGGYRVIAVDRRGYGRSPPGATDAIAVSLQARDVATTLDLRDVEASHLVGVSYGALVALELALAQPKRVLSLTLIEPTIFSWLKGDPDYAPWIHRFTELESLGTAGTPHHVWLEPWLSLIDPAMARDLRPGSPAWPLVEGGVRLLLPPRRGSARCVRRPHPHPQRGRQRAGAAGSGGTARRTPPVSPACGGGSGRPPASRPQRCGVQPVAEQLPGAQFVRFGGPGAPYGPIGAQ